MKFKFTSIRSRLTLWYFLILGGIILVADIVLYESFRGGLIDSIDNSLYMLAEEVEHTILKVSPTTWRKEIKTVRDEFLTHRFFIQVIEMPGKIKGTEIKRVIPSGVLTGSVYPQDLKDILFSVGSHPLYLDADYKSLSVQPIRVIFFPVVKTGEVSYIIQVGTSLKKTQQSLDRLIMILLVSGPFMLILSSIGGYLILTRAFNPVQAVVQAARKISTEDLSHRIDTKGKEDEIGELIETFNRMIGRLEQSVGRIKEFSSDVSHELRTPLTVMRGEIEVALRKKRSGEEYKNALNSVYEEVEKLETIIDNLLFLSHIDLQEKFVDLEETPLFEVLLDEMEKMKFLAQQKNIEFFIKKIEPLYIKGDAQLLERLILNLIDNAIKYTPNGGKIEFSLEKDEGKERYLLIIADNGIGIPAKSLPRVFERFYRVDKSRSHRTTGNSSGLGLAIAQRIAAIHNAEITIKSEIKRGTQVTVSFPIDNTID